MPPSSDKITDFEPNRGPWREPNWVEVTMAADRDWQAAMKMYWDDRWRWRGDTGWRPDIGAPRHTLEFQQGLVEDAVQRARADYRRRVLSWWWKLCVPLTPGLTVPKSVAELLAEELYGFATW